MSPKDGILHDYDLHANLETSAREQMCAICGASPMAFQWSDYSGQAMCTRCGCPYQLKWGTDEQQAEGKYPYLSLRQDVVPAIREYWEETHRWTCFGMMLGPQQGMAEFVAWAKIKHPELLSSPSSEESVEAMEDTRP